MNQVSIIGRLTRDPELKHLASGMAVCNLRLAVDRAGPKGTDDKPTAGFFDVDLFGKTAELAVQYLGKGRQVAIAGELRWREWETEGGGKRQAVSVVGNRMTFIGNRDDGDGGGNQFVSAGSSDFPAVPDDDIPF